MINYKIIINWLSAAATMVGLTLSYCLMAYSFKGVYNFGTMLAYAIMIVAVSLIAIAVILIYKSRKRLQLFFQQMSKEGTKCKHNYEKADKACLVLFWAILLVSLNVVAVMAAIYSYSLSTTLMVTVATSFVISSIFFVSVFYYLNLLKKCLLQ